MRYTVDEWVLAKVTVEIRQSDFTESPDEWGDEDTFLGTVSTRWITVGRKNWGKGEAEPFISFGEGPWDFENTDYYDLAEQVRTVQELQEAWEMRRNGGMEVFPVRLRDYGSGNVVLSECDHSDADGYVFVRVPWTSELGRLAYPDFSSEELVCDLVKTWNQYLSGEIYDVIVIDNESEDYIEVRQVYGYHEAVETARELINRHEKEAKSNEQNSTTHV